MENKKTPIGADKLTEGYKLLEKYKNARAAIDARIESDEEYFNSRHTLGSLSKSSDLPTPASAWMFASVVNKHADMMENMPCPVCLAREKSDIGAAEALNAILPVIFDRLKFTEIYSKIQYDKLKHGTAVYGVFWDAYAENGLGDINICPIDIRNLYTEPGVSNIEKSKNVFYVSLMDEDEFCEKYPNADTSDTAALPTGFYPTSVIEGKRLIIDWYYKKSVGTKTYLHFIKFSGKSLLYASENDAAAQNGFYAHGRYPFVLDILYEEKDTPLGYGLISITRTTQSYIDKLDENLLERSIMSAKPRYFLKKNVGLNKDEFLDWNNPIIEVDGDLTDERIKAITLPELDTSVLEVRTSKIDEMREAAANRTVNYGEAGEANSGVAIAALQEAGNKVSRDIQRSAWAAFVEVTKLTLELIREFYTEERIFRITSPNGQGFEYITFSGKTIAESPISIAGELFYRKPVFDIDVKADKASSFSRIARNETILNLCRLGLFDYENTDKALIVLDALELDGKRDLIEKIKKRRAEASGTSEKGETVGDMQTRDKLSEVMHSALKLGDDRG